MKIGIDARWIFRQTSGIGAYTAALIRALAKYGQENDYTLFFHDPVCRDAVMADPVFAACAGRMRTVMLPFGLFSLRGQLLLPGRLHAEDIDVFHSTNYMIPLPAFPRHRRGRLKAVVTIHDVIPMIFPDAAPQSRKSRFFFAYRRLMIEIGRRAHAVISDSETSRNDVIRHLRIPPRRRPDVVAVPCGVDGERFSPSNAISSGTDSGANRPRIVLYVGRYDPYKNVVGLLHALRRVRECCPFPVKLRLAGAPDPRYPEVYRTTQTLKLDAAVQWTGYLSEQDLVDAYRNADLLVLPSRYEGFGLPVVEAMACGTPVVCSNRGSLPEVAGEAAVVVDPDVPGALAEAMTHVLSDNALRARLRKAGLQRARVFSWETTARKTLAVYRMVTK